MNATIVVGVDESAASMRAVEFGAREAQLRDCRLRLLHACVYPGMHETWIASEDEPVNRLDTFMRQNAERARIIVPTLEVTTEVVFQDTVTALMKESHDAAAMVVGSHGFGGFSELLIGSTAVELSSHAGCPVFVTRGRAHPQGPVLLGLDGTPQS
ncbi:MAG TPA: universal stress protein, partial [Mycobacteriales bacterium]|nr:universal stress protein [Mycobacteriales bacterium]